MVHQANANEFKNDGRTNNYITSMSKSVSPKADLKSEKKYAVAGTSQYFRISFTERKHGS